MYKKWYKNVLIYEALYKNLIGAKSLQIIFDKIDGFISDYNGTKYLVLFGPKFSNSPWILLTVFFINNYA